MNNLSHRNDSLILLNGKYRNHLKRVEEQYTLLVNWHFLDYNIARFNILLPTIKNECKKSQVLLIHK
jgi:hypothetical protein